VDSGHTDENRVIQWMKAPKCFIQISYHNFHEYQWPSTIKNSVEAVLQLKNMHLIHQQFKHLLGKEPSEGRYEIMPPSVTPGGYEIMPPCLSGKLI